MEDDLISDEIYGDLGDFEFGEKLKEQCQKIEDLTDQLNKSQLALSDLQTQMKDLRKKFHVLEKNSSSLLLTAQVEIDRKNKNISELQRKLDNSVFRRRNAYTPAAVQSDTHATVDPVIPNCNANNNPDNISDSTQQHPVNNLSRFRIPKKNPFARHEHDTDRQDHTIASNGMENEHDEPNRQLWKKHPKPQARRHDLENEQHKKQNREETSRYQDGRADFINACNGTNGTENEREVNEPRRHLPKKNPLARHHDVDNDTLKKKEKDKFNGGHGDHGIINGLDDPRLHLPKKNPHARRHDIEQEIQKPIHEETDSFNGRRDENREQNHGDRGKHRDRRDERRDHRKHSPEKHALKGHRDNKKSHSNLNDQKRDSSRNGRKRSRARSSSDEIDRQKKRRSDSSSSRHRSRSRPARIDEKVKKTKSPRKAHGKRGTSNRRDEVKSKKLSVSSLKEKDLEAMLEAQKKILDEIDGTNCLQQSAGQNDKSSPEHRKRQSSHTDDDGMKMSHEDGVKATNSTDDDGNVELNRANDGSVEVLAEPKSTAEVLPVDNAMNHENSNAVDASPEMIEVLPVASENSIQDLPLVEAVTSTNSQKLCSPEVVKVPSESIDKIVEEDVPQDVSEPVTSESIDGKSDAENVSKEISKSMSSELTNTNEVGEDIQMSESTSSMTEEENSSKTISKSTTSESISKEDRGENVLKDFSTSTPSKPKNRKSDEKNSPKKISKSSQSDSISGKNDGETVQTELSQSTPSKLIEEKTDSAHVPNDVSVSGQLPNDENSNMDLDYELMEHTPHVENQTNLPCKESDDRITVAEVPKTMSPTTANTDTTLNETNGESFLSMQVDVHKGSESTLNSSQERHILSKSKEYTVEDAGYEIRIFLTKKRKKSKKVTS